MGDHDTKANNEPMPHVDRSVKSIVFHPQFSRTAFNMIGYDVALLKLNTPVDFAANLIPICLPENDNQLVDEIAWTQGFGALYEGKCLFMSLPTIYTAKLQVLTHLILKHMQTFSDCL